MTAVSKFDPGRDLRSFARPFIEGSIIDYLRREDHTRYLNRPKIVSDENLKYMRAPGPSVVDVIAAHELIGILGDRERRIVMGYFGKDYSQSEIALDEGLGHGRISQIIASAIVKMRLMAEVDPDRKNRLRTRIQERRGIQ